MELPKYHETFIPILEILGNGEMIHYSELQKKVRDKYYSNLPNDLLNKKTTT
jgi:restriction system protein